MRRTSVRVGRVDARLALLVMLPVVALAAQQPAPAPPPDMSVPAGAAQVEQTAPGERPPAALVASFEVYRKLRDRESLVAVHSVNTSGGGGGVRWYELQVDRQRHVSLRQQGTYAPDRFFRWMASPAIDRAGNIGIGYSFGGTPHFAGQRFAGRLANDPPGRLSLGETVLVEGEAAQNAMRWEDYTQTAVDPSDDCTIWYVGDYIRAGGTNYSTRIGAFRMPGCGQ